MWNAKCVYGTKSLMLFHHSHDIAPAGQTPAMQLLPKCSRLHPKIIMNNVTLAKHTQHLYTTEFLDCQNRQYQLCTIFHFSIGM